MKQSFRIATEAGDSPADPSLAERLTFERLLTDLSVRFANVPGDRVETEIERALRELIAFLGFDRSTFFEFATDGSMITLCSVAIPGVELVPVGTAFGKELTWYAGELRADRVVLMRSLPDDLPAEAIAEAEHVRRVGMRSNLTIPLSVGGRVIGALAFGAMRAERQWPPEVINRLSVVGQLFANALARKRSETELRRVLAENAQLRDRLTGENVYLRSEMKARRGTREVTGSRAVRRVLEQIEQVARTRSTVLLQGETGTGKELIARAIHDRAAARAAVREGELRGAAGDAARDPSCSATRRARSPAPHDRKGRFELADGGTLFLDEIGESPPRPAGEAAAGAAGAANSSASGGDADDQGRRARRRRHQPRPRARGGRRARSARTCTTG